MSMKEYFNAYAHEVSMGADAISRGLQILEVQYIWSLEFNRSFCTNSHLIDASFVPNESYSMSVIWHHTILCLSNVILERL